MVDKSKPFLYRRERNKIEITGAGKQPLLLMLLDLVCFWACRIVVLAVLWQTGSLSQLWQFIKKLI